MTTKARIVTALLGSSLWVGCQGGQIDEVAVTHQAALAIEANMNATAGALSFTTDGSGTFATAAKSTGLSLNTDDVSSMNGLSLPLMRGMLGSDMTQMMTGTGMPSVMTAEERTAETSAKLRRFMDERLFVPANLESKDGETATYLLHSDPSCRPLGDEGAPLPAVDQKCAKDLDAVAVRMRVEDDGGTTTIKVQLGPEHLELVSVQVSDNRVAIDSDLAQTIKAMVYANAQTDPGSEDPTHGATATGKIELYVKKAGPRKASAGFSVLQGLHVESPKDGLVMTLAASAPLFSVEGDGDTKTAAATLDLRAMDYVKTTVATLTQPAHQDHMKLGGYGGTVTIMEGSKTLLLRNLHYLDTAMDRDGAPTFSSSFNPASNHAVDADVTVGDDKVVHVALRPTFNLKMSIDPRPYATTDADRANSAPVSMSISLADPSGTAGFDVLPSKLHITTGTLVLEAMSTKADASGSLTVAAGQCLVERSSVVGAPPATGAFSSWIASACP